MRTTALGEDGAMRITSILCLGAFALLAMEIAYSLQLKQYEVPRYLNGGPPSAFFRGPITATLKGILSLDAPAEPAAIRSI